MHLVRLLVVAAVPTSIALLALACGSSSDDAAQSPVAAGDAGPRGVEPAGQSCTQASQCYAGLAADAGSDAGSDGGLVAGEITCLAKVTNGYCTHTCTADTQCCAAPGECATSVKEVCSPFSNQSAQYCFLSCEDEDVDRAIAAHAADGYYDGGTTEAGTKADAYCASFAGTSTTCRSSGGGNKNRKVCIPNE